MKSAGRELRDTARRPAIMAWLRMARIYQKVNAASAAHFRSADLSVGQFDVLAHLGTHEGITQQELAKSLLVTKGNVSQLLERMESRNLVTRCQEGRTKCLRLSPTGQRLYRSTVPAQESLIDRLFSSLSRRDQETLHVLLRRLDRGIR
jgi:DNA-binding MarR family transcriptional regulator